MNTDATDKAAAPADFKFLLRGVRSGMSQAAVYRIMVQNLVAWRRKRDTRLNERTGQ